jgi:hypothetical protein
VLRILRPEAGEDHKVRDSGAHAIEADFLFSYNPENLLSEYRNTRAAAVSISDGGPGRCFAPSLCRSQGGRVRVDYQIHDDEKNTSEFFERKRSPLERGS